MPAKKSIKESARKLGTVRGYVKKTAANTNTDKAVKDTKPEEKGLATSVDTTPVIASEVIQHETSTESAPVAKSSPDTLSPSKAVSDQKAVKRIRRMF